MSLSEIRIPSAKDNPINTFYINTLDVDNISFDNVNLPNLNINSATYIDNNHDLKSRGPLTNGQILIGSTGVPPTASTITAGTNIVITNGAGSISVSANSSPTFTTTTTTNLDITSLNINSATYINSSNELKSSATLTNGQMLLGSTGLAPIAATLTAGSNVVVTNGAGSVSIATSLTPTYTTVASNSITFSGGAPQTALNSYINSQVWTPILEIGGDSTGITYTVQTGVYSKIGQVVFISGALAVSSTAALGGTATISGLPFPTNSAFNDNGMIPCVWNSWVGSGAILLPSLIALIPGVGGFSILQTDSGGNSGVADQDSFNGGSANFRFSGFYIATT